MVSKDVMPDDYYELAANVSITCGKELNRRGLLDADDVVWLAPEGTTEFVEGSNMTKAAGNEKTIVVPDDPGEYKLYIVYADGTVSGPGEFTVYAGENTSGVNLSDGIDYTVSKLKPLEIEIKDGFTATLNGEEIESGYTIDEIGEWELICTSEDGEEETLNFTTDVLIANQLLTDNVTVAPEGEISLTEGVAESGMVIWLAPSGLSAFDETDPTQSMAYGGSATIKAPVEEGVYILTVVDADGDILSQSDARVTVAAE